MSLSTFSQDSIASITAMIATRTVLQPIDLVKIRLQCDTSKSTLSSIPIHIKRIWTHESKFRGFLKGHVTGQLLYKHLQ